MRRRQPTLHSRQRGVALLLVLWACTLLAILLGGYAALARTEGLQARYQFAQTQAHYAAALEHPIWPGLQSGITIGIGYDLGFVAEDQFVDEWKKYVHPFIIDTLSPVTKLQGKERKINKARLQLRTGKSKRRKRKRRDTKRTPKLKRSQPAGVGEPIDSLGAEIFSP